MSLAFLIQRPVAILTIVVGLLVLGVIGISNIPISLLPTTSIPQISVQLTYTGVAAPELDKTIVQPIRNQLLQVNQLKDIQSQTRDGQANIVLEFEFGTNTNLAFIEVNEKIDQIANLLPRDMERPRVLKASITDIPVFYLSVVPKTENKNSLELAAFAQTVLKRRIEQLPQVAFVDVSGYAEPQITLSPNITKLQSLGLTEGDLEEILKQNNLNLGSVLVQDGQYQYNIRFRSAIKTKEDIAAIFFRHEGQVLQLKDVAKVQLEAQTRRGLYLFNDKEAILLSVRKQADAQLFALKKEFQVLFQAFEKDYPNIDFHLSNDQSELLEVSIDNLRTSLLYGALFAVLIMFVFFRSWKAPLLIALAIPISLLLALLGFYLFDLSINIISLSGLVLGVGLMIDNSIIVIENIQQYRSMGFHWLEACTKGANEVIRPLISSALTTCSVFLPLIFLSGIAGTLFYDQAISITTALGASLLVAYVLLPTLLNLLGTASKVDSPKKQNIKTSFYTRSVDTVLHFKWLFLLFFIALIATIILPFRQLKQETFPELSRTAIALSIDWNEPITLEENQNRIAFILQNDSLNIQFSNSLIGEQQFLLEQDQQSINQATILLFFEEGADRLEEVIQKYFVRRFPSATLSLAPLKNVFDEVFGSNRAPLVMHLQKVGSNELPSPAEIKPVLDYFNEQQLFVNTPPLKEQYEVSIQTDKALYYEVSYEVLYQKLRSLFNDYDIGVLRTSSRYIPVIIGGEKSTLYSRIENAQIENSKGELLPLSHFVQFDRSQDYKTIFATKSGVAIDLDLPTYSEALTEKAKQFLRSETNLTAFFSGQAFEDQKIVRELSIILLVSILLLYLILAAQFESLVQPLIVILTVPVGIVGALFVLLWFGQSINIVSIIGMIVMSGIVVNDAILKVDMMNRLMKNHSLIESIHGAGLRRLKPIIMTSITTILALLPILFTSGLGAELQRPLAYAVIGGLIMGTFSSLYFIPITYFIIYKNR